MRKIPTIFVRAGFGRVSHVTPERTHDAWWVFDGEGVATRKYDGTCVMIDGLGRWWARRMVKAGKPEPEGFVTVDYDAETGITVGWEPIERSPFARFHAEALEQAAARAGMTAETWQAYPFEAGTYELVGERINGNPEHVVGHRLIAHAAAERIHLDADDMTYDGIKLAVTRLHAEWGVEGIVWHHPDGRMAKIKAKDFR